MYAYEEFLALGKQHPAAPVPPSPEEYCTIMYTSGTTGDPKVGYSDDPALRRRSGRATCLRLAASQHTMCIGGIKSAQHACIQCMLSPVSACTAAACLLDLEPSRLFLLQGVLITHRALVSVIAATKEFIDQISVNIANGESINQNDTILSYLPLVRCGTAQKRQILHLLA